VDLSCSTAEMRYFASFVLEGWDVPASLVSDARPIEADTTIVRKDARYIPCLLGEALPKSRDKQSAPDLWLGAMVGCKTDSTVLPRPRAQAPFHRDRF